MRRKYINNVLIFSFRRLSKRTDYRQIPYQTKKCTVGKNISSVWKGALVKIFDKEKFSINFIHTLLQITIELKKRPNNVGKKSSSLSLSIKMISININYSIVRLYRDISCEYYWYHTHADTFF